MRLGRSRKDLFNIEEERRCWEGMAVAEILRSMTIEVPIDVVAGELKDLFSTSKSIELMRDILPDFDAKHKIVEMDWSKHMAHMVYEDGGIRTTVDLTPVRDLTTVTIRVEYDFSNKEAAAVAVLAQLCAFESLEQGYKAGSRKRP
jgi:hypothetical protein